VSDRETRTPPTDAERAAAAALARLERDGPLAGHPAQRSRWRAVAAREQIDNGMGDR
jgi:hypothetical protein